MTGDLLATGMAVAAVSYLHAARAKRPNRSLNTRRVSRFGVGGFRSDLVWLGVCLSLWLKGSGEPVTLSGSLDHTSRLNSMGSRRNSEWRERGEV